MSAQDTSTKSINFSDIHKIKRIYLVGVAGTGMGAFAGLLKSAGYDVTGSDENVYPPMSDKLAEWGIPALTPYTAVHFDEAVTQGTAPDLAIVGNVIRRDNVEATWLRDHNWPQTSFPAALGAFFLQKRHSVVVSGTHGKTTTTSLLAHTLVHAGKDAGMLVGGIPLNFGESFRVGAQHDQNSPFVVEGDEYDTAYWDKGPKFLHYCPRSLLCTSLEYDHADIYPDVESIIKRFAQLLCLVPSDGQIVISGHRERGIHLARAVMLAQQQIQEKTTADPHTKLASITTYGDPTADVWAENVHVDAQGIHFVVCARELRDQEQNPTLASLAQQSPAIFIPLAGEHNLENALGAYVILRGMGLQHDEIAAGFATFAGVRRRMDLVGEADHVAVVDDFAHHPTAVATTIRGAKDRFAGRPVWAIFEPRSATSCRKVFQDDYARAFDDADRVFLAPSGRQLDPSIALDIEQLVHDVQARGKTVSRLSIDEIVHTCAQEAAQGTVLLCMSNGAFGGIHHRLLDALGRR